MKKYVFAIFLSVVAGGAIAQTSVTSKQSSLQELQDENSVLSEKVNYYEQLAARLQDQIVTMQAQQDIAAHRQAASSK